MNTVAGDMMAAGDRIDLLADVRGLCSDSDVGRLVRFQARGARTFSAGAGTATYAETETAVTGVVSALTDTETGEPVKGAIQIQVAADLFDADPQVFDRCIVSGTSYTITTTTTDALGATWQFTARKAA